MKLVVRIMLDKSENYKDLARFCRSEKCPYPGMNCPFEDKPCDKVRSTDWKHAVEDGVILEK